MAVTWIDEHRFEIGGQHFLATSTAAASDVELPIIKSAELVRQHLDLYARERPRRVCELGIKDGGSTALLALAVDPELLLAVDLEPTVPPALTDLIARRALGDRVTIAGGVDQGDRAALTAFLDANDGDHLDLVLDDASHILTPTRISFEILFPRLRPGGLYVIEDWATDQLTCDRIARVLPRDDQFEERLAAIRHLMHVLNSPVAGLPEPVRTSLIETAAKLPPGPHIRQGFDGLFDRTVEVAAHADLTALDASPIGRDRPLTDVGVELMLLAAQDRDLLTEVTMTPYWLAARRGSGPLDESFRLAAEHDDYFGYLPAGDL